MTATTADLDALEAETAEADPTPGESQEEKDNRDRDFTKVRPLHTELAAFVNGNEHFKAAGLPEVSPNQIKAVLYLRADYNNSPEREAERERKRAVAEAEKAKYAGLSDEQTKQVKAAQRKADSAAKMAERAKAAQAEADELIAKARATNGGTSVADEVEAAQNGSETPSGSGKSRPGIKRK